MHKEKEILKRRLELVKEMGVNDLKDYLMLWTALKSCFRARADEVPGSEA